MSNQKKEIDLNILEGKYYHTRGGWIAKVVHVSTSQKICYVIHNPGDATESAPILHDKKNGFALYPSILAFLVPPAYGGHPADLIEEVTTN
jgi:hypothetical protein